MKKTILMILMLGTIAAALWWSWPQIQNQLDKIYSGNQQAEQNNEKSLTMAIFPRRLPQVTRNSFQPLADHLQQQLGVRVYLITPATYKEFWDGVKSGHYDLVHFNQYHYVESHLLPYRYEAIVANEEGGKRTISGAIFVKSGHSEIQSLKDLKGKTIIFGGGKKAMVSYITTTALLRQAGLQESDYTTVFAKNPPFAIIDTFIGKGDAAAAGAHLLNTASVKNRLGQKGVDKMRILGITQPITHLPWAVHKNVSKEMRNAIQNIMTHLHETPAGKTILKSAKVSGFFAVNDADYDESRKLIQLVTGRSF